MSTVRGPKFNFVIRARRVGRCLFSQSTSHTKHTLAASITFCFAALLLQLQSRRVWVGASVGVRVIVAVVSFAPTFTVKARFANADFIAPLIALISIRSLDRKLVYAHFSYFALLVANTCPFNAKMIFRPITHLFHLIYI